MDCHNFNIKRFFSKVSLIESFCQATQNELNLFPYTYNFLLLNYAFLQNGYNFICKYLILFQLQQPEIDGREHCRRFRIENGDSPGEKDEVLILK